MAVLTHRLWGHGSVRFGTAVLGLMLLLSLFAPWLGTVDPAAMDANHINKALGLAGEFALPDGSVVAHTFWEHQENYWKNSGKK